MPRFRSIPIYIEALQYTGHNAADLIIFAGEECSGTLHDLTKNLEIRTESGAMAVSVGDWVVLEGDDRYCEAASVFESIWEPVA